MHFFDLARIGSGLVVSQHRDEIEGALAAGAVVVTAPPGTGKTTFVPPLVANALPQGRILVTQPRRVAVRAAARRIAQLDGSALGGPSGFTVRGERVVSDETRIETVTPGVLLRRLLNDPGLEDVAAVILDEVHERSVDGDLLLGLLGEVRALRDDLVLVAMSATLDADPLARMIGAPIVRIPSVLHPLDVAYAPSATPRIGPRGVERAFLDHVADLTVREQAGSGHDALVFVPSARDVDEVVRRIRSSASGVEALPRHGRLPAADQDRATSGRVPGEPPRIVVSTALAESSLTVPGVRLVIDAGLSREVRRDQARDMSGLVTVSASRASADQRAGRAARQGPGRAVRAYTEAEFAAFRAASDPEILSADLVDVALTLAEWGTPAGAGLELLTPPPAASMARAHDVLRALELVDGSGRPTPLGTRVARMPVGAREGRALVAAEADPRTAAEVVAAMAGDFREPGADLDALLRALRRGDAPGVGRWRNDVKRLARIAGGTAGPSPSAGTVAALARPDWIARRVADGSRSYLLASGTRAALPEGSSLAGSEWIAVAEVQRAEGRVADGTGAVIRLAAALAEADALEIGHVRAERVAWLEDGRVRVREERRLGSIVLSSTPAKATGDDAKAALLAHIREHGIPWGEGAARLRARLQMIHREIGAPWPDVSDEALLESLDEWLAPHVTGSSLASIDTTVALRGLLPWPEASRLDALAPERLDVPSGSSARIDYPAERDGRPVVAVKLQEVFGLAETPRLVDGRVPVQFHLLSPARRPLAVTEDLSSFWNGPYQDVRKEMRGRYPRHPWPEDPWTAPATAKTTKRMREG
ncbi:ATP-dependent helicase HrpB [Microbacterium sorbitolivorans]|uniref:ATP-dependent helicase HrpB n=1 Tax=Microbacterium sorbitolivorans TaxID=1867410 RepID=A0A367Y6Z8_9MICO|nr:ATP-dependent helicase HrpB [Microbacterium sorbitolivorans]RCK61618.1 ATP-dependent helicase HrpB [Microbacterium sorbitolivorans]GGF30614.1 ATP-dependent helicase HrpB [Microbacterium sorbitolivorans]